MIAAGYSLALTCPECGCPLEHRDGTPGAELSLPGETCTVVTATLRCTGCRVDFQLAATLALTDRERRHRAARGGAALASIAAAGGPGSPLS